MISRNRAGSLGSAGRVEQRFDVAADRGQRRPQLVRDVGDEIAADLIGAPQVGDVVQHEHGAAAAVAATGTRVRHERPRGARASSWTSTAPAAAAERGLDQLRATSGWRTTSR